MCVCGSRDLMGFPAQQNAPARLSHTHPPTRMRRAHAQTHTHTLRIDPPASRRVIHQMVGHTQVCFTVGQCSAAHSRSRQPSLEGREGETERWRREGNSYSNKMRSLEKKNSSVESAQNKNRQCTITARTNTPAS